MISPEIISDMLVIAERAIDVHAAEAKRKAARIHLTDAYVDWKDRNCFECVEPDTLEWVRMMSATKDEYKAFEAAKRKEFNARRRLTNAIDRYGRRAGR